MNNRINLTGLVLSVMPVGDYDRRVTILTKERGKITAFARGARRPGNSFLASTQPCVFGNFTLFPNRESYTISEVNVEEFFHEIREDIEQAYYAMYFCEVADFYTKEGNDEKEMLKLLYAALRALVKGQMSKKLIRAVFEMKVSYINGEGPLTTECVICHEKADENDRYFSVVNGGLVCGGCHNKLPAADIRSLNASTWYAVWFIGSTPVAKLFSFTLSPAVEAELALLSADYLFSRVKHEFKGEKLLEMVSTE